MGVIDKPQELRIGKKGFSAENAKHAEIKTRETPEKDRFTTEGTENAERKSRGKIEDFSPQ